MRKIQASKQPACLPELPLPAAARILFLAPHPDDFDSVAVTLKRLLDNGNDLRLAVLTGGAAGVLDSFVTPVTDARKDAVREQEQRDSLRSFGLPAENVTFSRLPVAADGELLADDDCRSAIDRIVHDIDPDVVFLPHGEDTNAGHRRNYNLFRELAAGTKKPLLLLSHRDPKTIRIRIDVYTPFGAREAEWKRALLLHHVSQHTRNLETRGSGFDDRILDVNAAIASELGIAEPFAEAFQVELFPPQTSP